MSSKIAMVKNRHHEDSQFGVLVACGILLSAMVAVGYNRCLNPIPFASDFPHEPASGEIRVAAARQVVSKETTNNNDQQDALQARIHEMDLALSRLKVDYATFKTSQANRQYQIAQQQALSYGMATGQLLLRACNEPEKNLTIPLVWVPPGTFLMGQTDTARIESATASGSSHFDFCVPSHYVHVKMGFFLGTTEVTRGQWMQFLRSTNTVPGDLNYPVTNVPYDAAIKYCEWLSQVNGITVRLPTEIEFEYALRGNCHVQETESSRERAIIMGGPWPVDAPELDDSWTGAVGLNSNVQEWCIDLWDDKLYEKRVSKLTRGNSFIYQGFDASAISSESPRVVRGASFRDIPANKHPALRRYKSSDSREDSLGFRVVVPITASLISRKGD